MPSRRKIRRPGDLPRAYQARWQACAARYKASRLFGSDESAERAAFEDIRTLYWNEAASACDGDTAPGFALADGDDAAADRDAGPKD